MRSKSLLDEVEGLDACDTLRLSSLADADKGSDE